MERTVTVRSGRLTWRGGLVAGVAATALLVAGCSAPSNLGGGKPSPSPKSSTSPARASGKYVPSKWINSKGVFVAPPDSAASASVKAQWKLDYGTVPPPVGFISGLGHVPVNNQTSLPQAEANTLGQGFLLSQGYEDYFLAEGSVVGLQAAGGAGVFGDFGTVAAALEAGAHVQVVGCALPTTLSVVTIPSPLGPPAGDTYGVLAGFTAAPSGHCALVAVSKSGASHTLISYSAQTTLYAGSATKIAALGVLWNPVGGWICPGYQAGAPLTSVCVAS